MIGQVDEQQTCEAYGPDLPGACFFDGEATRAAIGGDGPIAMISGRGRHCGSAAECGRRMDAERHRVFRLIHEAAAKGDPDFVYLAAEFPTPELLLRAPADGDG